MRQTFEERRQALQSSSFRWGDPPPSLSHGVNAAQPPSTLFGSNASMKIDMGDVHPANLDSPRPRITTRGWTLSGLLSRSENFLAVPRLDVSGNALYRYDNHGVPLVIEGLHRSACWNEILTLESFLKLSAHSGEIFH